MFVREIQKANGATAICIVESFRSGDKVKQKTIRSLGQHKDPKEIEFIKRAAEQLIIEIKNNQNPVLPIFDPKDFFSINKAKKKEITEDQVVQLGALKEQARVNDGINEVFGSLYEQLNLDSLITNTKQDAKWNETLKVCALARIAQPESKQKTVRLLEENFNIKIDIDHVYRMMDHVALNVDKIKQSIANVTQTLLDQPVDALLFDVTTLYFESTDADELREFGFSKDCKFNQTQVVLALVTTTEGLPISYELFAGNTYEGHTLTKMVEALKTKYTVSKVVLVADRAMFNIANLNLMDSLDVEYVVAAKLRSLNKDMQGKILNSTLYRPEEVKQELHWINTFNLDKRRLIVSYSSDRAKKDKADRQRLIDKMFKKVKNGKIKITDLVSNQGSKKFIKVLADKAELDHDKIERDAQWDGLHGVITNIKGKTPKQILGRYRDLWRIEEAFRINKHDLKMRPIYHWKTNRIKAHIAICYIAFALLSYTKYKLNKANAQISLETLREELLKAQSSIVLDTKTKTYFAIPSKITENQKAIYKAFGLRRKQAPCILASA